MKHLGDVTKISGYTAPIVDVIIGGSPCQDLSVAGKRAGLEGERSGLFMEQVRIVKEMRKKDAEQGRAGVDVRPRYMVWENVPGAFSSNKGEDFRIVLEELAKVADKDAVIPMPNKGKWTTCGCIVGDGWSIAWRVLDAQFWGVPQRRRRIALVADFGGQSAPEVLLIRKSMHGHSESSKPKRKESSSDAQGGFGADDREGAIPYTLKIRSGCEDGVDLYNQALTGDKTQTIRSVKSDSDYIPCVVYSGEPVIALDRASFNQGKNDQYDFEVSDKGVNSPLVAKGPGAVCYGINGDKAGTLDSSYYKVCGMRQGVERDVVAYGFDPSATRDVGQYFLEEKGNVLVNGTCPGHHNGVCLKKGIRYIVRRLTPLECERLQGYPSELKLDVSKMTKDEYIAYNILEGNIVVDAEAGKVYRTRGPGGVTLDKPQEMKGSDCNGYLVVKISNGTTKMSCRVHRIIWISQYGVIPDGYCIDHINSDKKDNRISNLQLLTPQENSTKAAQDGLYATGEDNGATKISPDLWDEIAYLHHCECKTMRQLAEIYGISKSRIQQIVKEVGWTDIGEWTDSNGKRHQTSDAARYRALGNSIALPPWKWILKRLCACYERDATMASLFDGIGGFPYLWEQLNGKGSCLWASEIEEFQMAVTKVRIGGDT